MDYELFLPHEFGSSWNDFVHDWCLEANLGYAQIDVIDALSTLKRFWPDHVSALATHTARGVNVIAPAVELGRLLTECEAVPGFTSVFERVKKGDRSAYSELAIGSSLSRLGYHPNFIAPIEGKNLDVKCEVEHQPVYFEVIAPQTFNAGKESLNIINELSGEIMRSVSGCRIEVELFSIPTESAVQAIVAASRTAVSGKWVVVESIARLRKSLNGQALAPVFDSHGPQITIAGDKTFQGASTSGIIRWDESDYRAKRLFNAEYHHFSKRVANVLIINVSSITGGMAEWPPLIERLLQPNRNRNVGAVAFFNSISIGPPEAIRYRWKIIVNPYAHIAVPPTLIESMKSLDESHFLF